MSPSRRSSPFSDGVFSIVFRYTTTMDLNAQTVVLTPTNIIDGDGVGTDSYPPAAEGAIVQRVFSFEDGGSAAYSICSARKLQHHSLRPRQRASLFSPPKACPSGCLTARWTCLPYGCRVAGGEGTAFTYAAGMKKVGVDEALALLEPLNPTALIARVRPCFIWAARQRSEAEAGEYHDGSLGDTVDLPPEVLGKYFYTGGGHDLYIRNNSALWGVDFSDDGSGGLRCDYKSTINWVNSDLVPADICTVCIADERTMALTLDSGSGIRLYLLKAVPDAEVVERRTSPWLCSAITMYISAGR